MKGSTQVSVDRVVRALQRYTEYNKNAKAVFNKAITDFANLKRSTWFGKWKAGDKTDKQVAASYLGSFQTWEDILFEVVGKEDLELIANYTWNTWDSHAHALENLVQVCDTGFVQVGPVYAGFIDNFTPKAQ